MSLPRPSRLPTDAAQPAPAVLLAAATGLADFIGAQGGDVDSIYGSCGVSPRMSTLPTLKLPLATFCNLFEAAARRTGCDNFGLWFGRQFQPRDLGMWGYAALSSPTLGSALDNLVELFPYQQSASTMRLIAEDGNRIRLEYRIDAPAILARRQDAELSLGQFSNVVRECCGRSWSPLEIRFEHPRPAEWRQHETAFGAPVFFGCPANAIVFDRDILERPMPGRDLKLLAMMRTCLELIGPRAPSETLVDRIRTAIRQHLPDGAPTLEGIAAELRVPASAIRRALLDEGLGFREAVDAMRFRMAQHYLGQPHLPLSEIALLLGYSELSAFTRAFTRWAGTSPRSWRSAARVQ
jgi:AraC-like DNA-binding protein